MPETEGLGLILKITADTSASANETVNIGFPHIVVGAVSTSGFKSKPLGG